MREADLMKINFLDQIKSSVVFKFLYAPKMITPEGIVFFDQLHEESSLAAGNVEQAQSQPRWEHEEQALLVVEYFLYKNSEIEIEKSNEFISKLLRLRGMKLGIGVGEKYRNIRGIQTQRENLSHFDPEYNGRLTGHESKWMESIMSEYLQNPDLIKREAYEMLKKYLI